MSGFAIASLVCSLAGIAGLLFAGPILGVVFGHLALREIDRSDGIVGGHGLAMAGLIVGYVALALSILALVPLLWFAGGLVN
jgi:hypothetical protein